MESTRTPSERNRTLDVLALSCLRASIRPAQNQWRVLRVEDQAIEKPRPEGLDKEATTRARSCTSRASRMKGQVARWKSCMRDRLAIARRFISWLELARVRTNRPAG